MPRSDDPEVTDWQWERVYSTPPSPLYKIHDLTRGECFVTDEENGAHRFFAARTKLYPAHALRLLAVGEDECSRELRRYG